MTMKLYMTPGSCSTGIHILLEEIGVLFEAHLVNLLAGDQKKPEYLAINPEGTVPTLVTDTGVILTRFQSIALWLARAYPDFMLMPLIIEQKSHVLEVMNYAVMTLHGEGFARIFTTDKFSSSKKEAKAVMAEGHSIINEGFATVNQWLDGKKYVVDKFSIADAAIFYVEFWADKTDTPLPENCLAHYQRMLKRPAVRQVLREEGYSSMFQNHKKLSTT